MDNDLLLFKFQFIVLLKISPKRVISTGAERNGEIFARKNHFATTIMRRSLDYARDDASFGGVPMNCSSNQNPVRRDIRKGNVIKLRKTLSS